MLGLTLLLRWEELLGLCMGRVILLVLLDLGLLLLVSALHGCPLVYVTSILLGWRAVIRRWGLDRWQRMTVQIRSPRDIVGTRTVVGIAREVSVLV